MQVLPLGNFLLAEVAGEKKKKGRGGTEERSEATAVDESRRENNKDDSTCWKMLTSSCWRTNPSRRPGPLSHLWKHEK